MKKPIEGKKYCRKCSVTGRGMNEGFYVEHGNADYYFCTQALADAFAMGAGFESFAKMTEVDEELEPWKQISEPEGYWTDWEDDYQYIVKGGQLIEIN